MSPRASPWTTPKGCAGPRPGTHGPRASWSRHRGLARRRVARSSSRVAMRALRQALWAAMSWVRRPLVPARRGGAAVRMPRSGWRRP